MRVSALISASIVSVSAYGQTPACSDPRTVQLVRQIFTESIERKAAGHVAFGSGIHGCVGQMVARLEADCVLTEMARRIAKLTPAGKAERKLNNSLRSFAALPVEIVPR